MGVYCAGRGDGVPQRVEVDLGFRWCRFSERETGASIGRREGPAARKERGEVDEPHLASGWRPKNSPGALSSLPRRAALGGPLFRKSQLLQVRGLLSINLLAS